MNPGAGSTVVQNQKEQIKTMALRPVLALVALAATCQAFTAPMGVIPNPRL